MVYDKITNAQKLKVFGGAGNEVSVPVKKIGIPQNADYYRIEEGKDGCDVIFYDINGVMEKFGNIIGFECSMACARLHEIPEKWKGKKMSYQEKHKRGNVYFFIEFED